jgi:hypothetical protein
MVRKRFTMPDKSQTTQCKECERLKSALRDCIVVAEAGFGKPMNITLSEAYKYIARIKAARVALNG